MGLSAFSSTSVAAAGSTWASAVTSAGMAWGEPEALSPWQEDAVEKVAWAISEDSMQPLDMEALCALAGMSPMHLERAFHLCLGIALKTYAQTEWQKRLRRDREQRGGGGYGVAREWLITAI